ncbi:outer membrane protein [Afipia sp. TerB]
MRRWILAAAMAGAVQGAQAADLPDFPVLRGGLSEGLSRSTVVWQGYYIGGQVGTGWSNMDFSGSTSDLAAQLLTGTTIESESRVSDWPVLGKRSSSGNGYGGFIGYNGQWEDVVLGVEASYMHGNFGGSDSNSMGRSFTTSDGYTNGVTYQASTQFKITDMGSVRARAGYVIGSFLPYMFGGVSLGLADITKSVTISGRQVNPAATPPFDDIAFALSGASGQSSRFIYGYAAGLGVDMMLWGNLFARAEWEYLKFAGPVDTSVNTIRGGLGYKF